MDEIIQMIARATPVASPSEKPSTTMRVTINGPGTVIIGNGNSHGAAGPSGGAKGIAISEKQCAWLRSLVDQISTIEARSNPGYSPAKVWLQLNKKLDVATFRDIPRTDFDRAKGYLEGWLRNLGNRSEGD